MRKVEIYFNPYSESTRLIIDDEERRGGETRLEEFIVGQPLDKWLSPYVFSYQKWNGLLPELMEDLNDDDLHLTFFTLPEYVSKLAEEFDKQTPLIEEKGYSSDLWRCLCEEAFRPEEVRGKFLNFVAAKKRFAPDQWSLSLFDQVEESLNDKTKSDTVNDLRGIYKDICEAVQSSKEVCMRNRRSRKAGEVHFWEEAEQEFSNIFD